MGRYLNVSGYTNPFMVAERIKKDRDDKLICCRDCKYARKSLLFKGKLKCRNRPGAYFYTLPDDFCSCGRHKT